VVGGLGAGVGFEVGGGVGAGVGSEVGGGVGVGGVGMVGIGVVGIGVGGGVVGGGVVGGGVVGGGVVGAVGFPLSRIVTSAQFQNCSGNLTPVGSGGPHAGKFGPRSQPSSSRPKSGFL